MIKAMLIVVALSLSGCSMLEKVLPTGGGVNTNAQVGQENTQQVVGAQTNTDVQGDMNTSQVSTQSAGEIRVANTNVPIWVMLLVILGWMLPSPGEMWRGFKNLFRRR